MNLWLLVLVVLAPSATLGYHCSWNYEGQCYDCPYNNKMCHSDVPSTVYTNGKIYTVDPNDPNWHK